MNATRGKCENCSSFLSTNWCVYLEKYTEKWWTGCIRWTKRKRGEGSLERELIKLEKKIEQAWNDYRVLQDMYSYYTGKNYEWLK